MILGLDSSHYTKKIDWVTAKEKGGVQWMYTKGSEGKDMFDHSDGVLAKAAQQAGVLASFYHFMHANVDGKSQLDMFLESIDGLKFDLPHVLDWEEGSVNGQPKQKQIDVAQVILDGMEKSCGKPPWIYMGRSLAISLSLPSSFSRYPIIVARYGVTEPENDHIPPWAKILACQYSESAIIPGVQGGVDADIFYGTMGDLLALKV